MTLNLRKHNSYLSRSYHVNATALVVQFDHGGHFLVLKIHCPGCLTPGTPASAAPSSWEKPWKSQITRKPQGSFDNPLNTTGLRAKALQHPNTALRHRGADSRPEAKGRVPERGQPCLRHATAAGKTASLPAHSGILKGHPRHKAASVAPATARSVPRPESSLFPCPSVLSLPLACLSARGIAPQDLIW